MSGPEDLNRRLEIEEELESPEQLPGEAFVFEADEDEVKLEPRVVADLLENLSNNLVWKIGKEEGSERVIVRVGYATATHSFADLPRLRGATDAEIADAARHGELIVEWIE